MLSKLILNLHSLTKSRNIQRILNPCADVKHMQRPTTWKTVGDVSNGLHLSFFFRMKSWIYPPLERRTLYFSLKEGLGKLPA